MDTRACRCCGLIQSVPHAPSGMQPACARCGTRIVSQSRRQSRHVPIALAAIILYPIAISLPMLEIQQFGHRTQTSVLGGIAALFGDGSWLLALIVLLCSVVFPVGKLLSLLMLSWTSDSFTHEYRAFTYRMVEWTGRWGMLDVLLVAVLVAALKLGNVMDVAPGPAAIAFAACVALSILATALFDPHQIWEHRS